MNTDQLLEQLHYSIQDNAKLNRESSENLQTEIAALRRSIEDLVVALQIFK